MCRKEVNMVQAPDFNNQPTYSAVRINIKNPTVNASDSLTKLADGKFNAVDINIDNPQVNTEPQNQIYSYPDANQIVTYDLAGFNKIPLPAGFPVAYHTTNVILPDNTINNEIEFELDDEDDEPEIDAEEVPISDEIPVEEDSEDIPEDIPEVPEASYTTVEAEKGEDSLSIKDDVAEEEIEEDKIPEDVEIVEAETNDAKEVEIKRPEIIPGEEIKPDVDIPLVISNLTNSDFDIQAQQMEEIARISLDNSENAIPYIVQDVFSNLIDIVNRDTTDLAAPTDKQVEIRKKLITNFIAVESAKQKNPNAEVQLPYKLSEQEIALANDISPMEQAERNKEYALYTISILDKIYTDEVEKQTGNIVPLTDLPGTSAIVDALRFNPNAGVKVASLDALRHIQRPEYKEELTTLYTLAQADSNPEVVLTATRALNSLN